MRILSITFFLAFAGSVCIAGDPEIGCDLTKEFDCGGDGKMCIPLERLCDGENDCGNLADEPKGVCGVDECFDDIMNNEDYESTLCDQLCIDLPIGYKCACKEGYKLIDNSCKEIPVEHEGEGCFRKCKKKQGTECCYKKQCKNYCGDGGLCCRKNPNKRKKFIGNGCNGEIGGRKKHECVVNPLWKPPVTDCSTDETACDNNTNGKTACFNDDCVAPVTVNECANDDTACDDNTNGLTACVNGECTPPAVEVKSCTGDSTACDANTNGKTVCTWNPAVQDKRADLCYDTGTVTEATIKVGLRVKRGQDWIFDDQDRPNGLGTVTKESDGGWWSVIWENSDHDIRETPYEYRVGYEGKYDLKTA